MQYSSVACERVKEILLTQYGHFLGVTPMGGLRFCTNFISNMDERAKSLVHKLEEIDAQDAKVTSFAAV